MADTVVFPKEGRPIILGLLAGAPRQPNGFFSVRLFTDHSGLFDDTLTIARFTEASWPGYASVVMQFKDNEVKRDEVTSEDVLQIGAENGPFFMVQWGERTAKGFWAQDNHTGKVLFAVKWETPATVTGPGKIEPVLLVGICACAG